MLVEKINEKVLNPSRSKEFYFSPSRAGLCKRFMFFEIKNKENQITRKQERIFLDGHLAEDGTIDFLRNIGINITNNQMPVNIEIPDEININKKYLLTKCPVCDSIVPEKCLHGHIDGLLKSDNENEPTSLFEHKAVNDKSFTSYIKNGISTSYIKQVCLYLRGLDLSQCILLAKNKNNAEFLECLIIYEKDTDTAILKHQIFTNNDVINKKDFNKIFPNIVYNTLLDFQSVSEFVEKNEIPFKDITNNFCSVCPYIEICNETFVTKEKNTLGKVTIDNFVPSYPNKNFKDLVQEYREIKQSIDIGKERITEIKNIILEEMLQQKIKKIEGNEYDIIYFTKEINKDEIDQVKLKEYLGDKFNDFIISNEINVQEVLWIKEKNK